MNLTSKKISLAILAMTALAFSRSLFALFNDPEGTNLLVTTVTAAFIFCVSLAARRFTPLTSLTDGKKLLLTVLFQLLTVTILYFLLR